MRRDAEPSGRSSFALRSMMPKKLENFVLRTHPCLTPLEMGKLPNAYTAQFMLS